MTTPTALSALLANHPAPWECERANSIGDCHIIDATGDAVMMFPDEDQAFYCGIVAAVNLAATARP